MHAGAEQDQGQRYNTRGNGRSYGHHLDIHMNDTEPNVNTYGSQFLLQAINISYKMEQRSDKRVYGTQFLQQAVENMSKRPGDLNEYTCHYMFNQMTAKKGISKHGEVAII